MHFDEKGNFKRVMLDKTTGRVRFFSMTIDTQGYIKLCTVTQPTRNLKSELLDSPFELTREEQHLITQLEDLLSQWENLFFKTRNETKETPETKVIKLLSSIGHTFPSEGNPSGNSFCFRRTSFTSSCLQRMEKAIGPNPIKFMFQWSSSTRSDLLSSCFL